MGGRSLASVPCPWRVWARRRGGSVGSRWGVLLFPRVLVERIRLTGGAGHDRGRRGRVPMGLEALPQGVELCARHPQLARQARRRLALGHTTPPPDEGGRPWPCLGKDRPCQQRIVAVAGPTPRGWQVTLRTAHASYRASAVGAVQAVGVKVPLQPSQGSTIVESRSHGNIDHRPM
jgi:hypothetical protein